MALTAPPRVFISYTAEDLMAHADVVADVVRKIQWIAIDHRDWVVSGRPSVEECKEYIDGCSVLVVLVAHRYGWVPSPEEGGDGEHSITWLEVAHAKLRSIPVLPFLVDEKAFWQTDLIEGLADARALERLRRFKAELRKNIAGFFTDPNSLDGPMTRALLLKAEKYSARSAAAPAPKAADAAREESLAREEDEVIIPWSPDVDAPRTLLERLSLNLPKRILSLDAGAPSTATAFGYLERVERILQARYGSPDFRLSDYFDLIGGTAESAIVAAALALGHEVSTAMHLFMDVMPFAYVKNGFLSRYSRGMYDASHLDRALTRVFGEITLGDERLRTGLCLSAWRLDRPGPFPFINHPAGPGFSDVRTTPLKEAVLASMSMPVYYKPRVLSLASGEKVVLASGGASVGDDPSLYLFLLATNSTLPLRWRIGARRLFLLSIGAERLPTLRTISDAASGNFISGLSYLPATFMEAARYQSHMLLRSLAYGPEGPADVKSPPELRETARVLTYKRYSLSLDAATVAALGQKDLAERVDSLDRTQVSELGSCYSAGRAAAAREVLPEDFSPSFDVRKPVGLEARAPADAADAGV